MSRFFIQSESGPALRRVAKLNHFGKHPLESLDFVCVFWALSLKEVVPRVHVLPFVCIDLGENSLNLLAGVQIHGVHAGDSTRRTAVIRYHRRAGGEDGGGAESRLEHRNNWPDVLHIDAPQCVREPLTRSPFAQPVQLTCSSGGIHPPNLNL